MPKKRTHEAYISAIYKLALRHPSLTGADRKLIRRIKLTYGAGPEGVRGVTYYGRWHPGGSCSGQCAGHGNGEHHTVDLVAICATGQESHVQVCGTVLHELGHVIAPGEGHGKGWLESCKRLGLIDVRAAGTEYTWGNFDAWIGWRLKRLGLPQDGAPITRLSGSNLGAYGTPIATVKLRPCGAGYGTRGGKSTGKGSGSRLLLYQCRCEKPVKIRHAGHSLKAKCMLCSHEFRLVQSSLPATQKEKIDEKTPSESPQASAITF